MLTTHAVLYLNLKYMMHIRNLLILYPHYYNDVLIARLQPKYIVLANKKPSFYQSHRFNICMHQENQTKFELQ